ncbi:PAS domain S-box protein [Skermanella mucosa]|uniref:hybrid sensor histidine kinase/response regulator n=1 Tax=Skermanella mucosa TaxID=1789672 RepID=UPI001E5D0892|nr:PAS domain-containing sensor histidine kinase [Skermanella mucosa]UEM20175.1 PAS domain S-box protein [Skermanella mucosa]
MQEQVSSSALDLAGPRLSAGEKPSRDGVLTRTAFVGAGGLAAIGAAGLGLAAGGIVTDPVALSGGMFVLLAAGGAVLARRISSLQASGRGQADVERAMLASAFQAGAVGRMISGRDGRVVQVNAAFRHLAGAAGKDPLESLRLRFDQAPDMASRFRGLVEAALRGDGASAELSLGPGRSWLLVRVMPLADADPAGVGPGSGEKLVKWVVEDITERKRAEQQLRDEQANLSDFMGSAPIGFYSVDQDGRFLYANATLAEWLGCTPADLVGGSVRLHDVLAEPPPSPSAAHSPFAGAESGGDVTMKGLGGRRFQASVVQTVVASGDGRSLRTRSVVRDLTPEREWREALHLSEQRFQSFFEEAPIGIALIDEGGRLAECNQAFLTMVGRPLRSIMGCPLAELFSAGERSTVVARLEQIKSGSDMIAPFEVNLRALGRDKKMAQLYARRMAGGSGNGSANGSGSGDAGAGSGSGMILHFIDLTEQKSLEAQFAQSQKMQAIGQLAGGVAHDFNNLLTAMIGFCDLLLLRHKPGDQSFSDIMQIKQNANRAANLVRQLLAFSRQQTLQPRVLNITDVLAELSNLLRRLIGENIELKMTHGRDLGLIKVDQGQLEQVIINLAVNARDAMSGGGRLTIQTSNVSTDGPTRREHEEMPPGEYVAIEVSDTGIGIPKENLARIFEPFFSTKEVGSGTGLGLSTVYGIVRQTGGFIFVDSAPGEGAKFTIYLPRHQSAKAAGATAEAESEARERSAGDLTGTGTILLVEDEDAVRVFSARALRNKGYQVLEARSGEAALSLLNSESNRVDLLVSDVVMPHMDGPTLIRHVRDKRPEMKVIFISGYTEDKFRDQIDAGEHIHFLPKPFSLKQLAGKVKEVLRDG